MAKGKNGFALPMKKSSIAIEVVQRRAVANVPFSVVVFKAARKPPIAIIVVGKKSIRRVKMYY